MPTSGPGSVASAEVVSYEAIRAAWLQLRMPYTPGASETVSVVPHSCLWRNSEARSSVRRAVICTESNSPPRKKILCTGERLLFSQLTRSPNWLRCRSTKSCREHISLLIILCIIVYVTNKAHGWSGGWCIAPGQVCWIASVCCCTAKNCWAKPSTVSPNSPAWEMEASRKHALSTSFFSARLSQRWRSWTTMVDIAFPRDHTVTFVTRRATSASTLVYMFERLGLVNLQDSHGVQGGGCLARSAISFGRERGCQLTGLGWETRTVPPSGGVSWAQVHRDRSLHLGNARVPPGHSAVEGSEDGRGGRVASGHVSGHPRLCQLLMHLREERHRGRARLWAGPAARARDWAVCWSPARCSRLPGQAWPSALGPVWRWRQHTRGAAPPHLHPQRTWAHPPMLRLTSYLQMVHRMKCWAPRGTDQRYHLGTGQDVRCVKSKRSVGACPAEMLLLKPSDLPEIYIGLNIGLKIL